MVGVPDELLAPMPPHSLLLMSISEDNEEYYDSLPDLPTSGLPPVVNKAKNNARDAESVAVLLKEYASGFAYKLENLGRTVSATGTHVRSRESCPIRQVHLCNLPNREDLDQDYKRDFTPRRNKNTSISIVKSPGSYILLTRTTEITQASTSTNQRIRRHRLRSGFWHVEMEAESRPFTAFTFPGGHYEYNCDGRFPEQH